MNILCYRLLGSRGKGWFSSAEAPSSVQGWRTPLSVAQERRWNRVTGLCVWLAPDVPAQAGRCRRAASLGGGIVRDDLLVIGRTIGCHGQARKKSSCRLRHCRRHRPLYPLNSATAASDHFRHLEDAVAGTKLSADGVLDLPTDLRPSQLLDPLFADAV
jgi:hypothetical protein